MPGKGGGVLCCVHGFYDATTSTISAAVLQASECRTHMKTNKTQKAGWASTVEPVVKARINISMLRKPFFFFFYFPAKTSIQLFQFAHLSHAPSPPDAIDSDTSKRSTTPNHDTLQQQQKLPPSPALHLQAAARSLARPSRGTGYDTNLAQRHRRIAFIHPIIPIEIWRESEVGRRKAHVRGEGALSRQTHAVAIHH